jgi:predicted negative regulator of RcsB-dependent stress response
MKRDALVDSAQSFFGWLEEHKSQAILFAVILVAVVVIGVGSILFYQHRQAKASAAFSAAMDIYSAPLQQSEQAEQSGQRTYPSAAARAKAANVQFLKVADQYGSTGTGKRALYFAGITYREMGDTGKATETLKKVASKADDNLAALANLALAGIYRENGKTADAAKLLNQLADHPTSTVPWGEAKLQLAALYANSDPEKAKLIYAKVKDKDQKTAAGQIAAQKLQQMK